MSSQLEPQFEHVEPRQGLENVYSNVIHLQWTNHDVRLKFGELVKITEPTKNTPKRLTIEERVAVTLPWAQTKYLASLLQDLIQKYERLNGEIKTPQAP